MKYRIIIIISSICVGLLTVGILLWATVLRPEFGEGRVIFGDHVIHVEIARNAAAWSLGLQNRDDFPYGEGMLFTFGAAVQPSFWMKNTLIPLDMIWIADEKVVDISENVPTQIGVPDTELLLYTPTQPVTAVVEVAAGTAAAYGIAVGDRVVIEQKY